MGWWGGKKVWYYFLKQWQGFLKLRGNAATKCFANIRFIVLYKGLLSCKILIAHGRFNEKKLNPKFQLIEYIVTVDVLHICPMETIF